MDGLSGVFSAITNFAPGLIPGAGPQGGAPAGPVTPTAALTGVGQLVTALGGLASSLAQSGLGQSTLGTPVPGGGPIDAAAPAGAAPLPALVDPALAAAGPMVPAGGPAMGAQPQLAMPQPAMAQPALVPGGGQTAAGAAMCGCAGPVATAGSPMLAMPAGMPGAIPGGGPVVPGLADGDLGLQDTLGEADAMATSLQSRMVPGGGGELADADGADSPLAGLTADKLGNLGDRGVDFFSNILDGISGSTGGGDESSYADVMASGDSIVSEYGGSGGAEGTEGSEGAGGEEALSDADGAASTEGAESSSGSGASKLASEASEAFSAFGELSKADAKTLAKDETISAFWTSLEGAEESDQAAALGSAFAELTDAKDQAKFEKFVEELFEAFGDGEVPEAIASALKPAEEDEA